MSSKYRAPGGTSRPGDGPDPRAHSRPEASLECERPASGEPPRAVGECFLMIARRRVRGIGALLVPLLWLPGVVGAEPAAPANPADSAVGVVEDLHAALLDVMQHADALGYAGRHDRLAPILKRLFDIPYMAQKSVGRHWKTASEAERVRLVDTFTRFTVANYAGRFDGYSGQHFETLGEEPSLHGTVLVHTRLVEDGEEAVQLNYRLRRNGDGWQIIDVYLNGTVSEIALRRSEYSSLISRDGMEALLVALDEKISDLATATPAGKS